MHKVRRRACLVKCLSLCRMSPAAPLRNLARWVYLVRMTTATTATGFVPEWTITDRLRKARELTGLDQETFAKDIGASRGTVSNYERGSKTHQKSVLMTWAMRSGVPLEWLLTGRSPSTSEPESTRSYQRPALHLARAA